MENANARGDEIMRRLLARALLAGGAAAAAVALTTSSASALTWTVTGSSADGSVSASAGTTQLIVHHGASNVTLQCTSSNGTGSVPNVTGSNGTPIGNINGLNFTNCVLGGTFPFTVVTNASTATPWNLNVGSQAGSVVSGQIPTGISADISGSGCTARVSGPLNTSDGSVPLTYDNNTATLSINGGGNLTIHNVVGCGGLIAEGDAAEFFANYAITPNTLRINGA
jgi:hypothetical protein